MNLMKLIGIYADRLVVLRAPSSDATPMHSIRDQLIEQLWLVYQHEQAAMAIYQGLAARTANPIQRDIFLRLARAEARRIERRAEILLRLGAHAQRNRATLLKRAWQQMLILLGPRYALAWIRNTKKRDVNCQMRLIGLLEALREAGQPMSKSTGGLLWRNHRPLTACSR